MKKLLIASMLLTGLAAFAPSASAWHGDREFVGYDRCGRPVFSEVYRPRTYCDERPSYRYAPPVRYRSYDRGYDDRPRCRDTRRRVTPLSFIFGF
jgi:hypothetical protein